MAIDGTFIHYLTQELKNKIEGGRVGKVMQLNQLEFVMQVRSHGVNYQLLFSSSLNIPRVQLTKLQYIPLPEPLRLGMFLRKNLEGAIIRDIQQLGNDRAIRFTFDATNEIGDRQTLLIFIEMMGRNSNIIITWDDLTIIDACRYLPPSNENYRSVIPKAKYVLPYQEEMINPYEVQSDEILSNYSGCSKLLINEFKHVGKVQQVINQEVDPTVIDQGGKQYFHAFDLSHLEGKRTHYHTLSDMLDSVYGKEQKDNTEAIQKLKNLIKREVTRAHNKMINLKYDLEEAANFLNYQKWGELLQANIYKIHKGDELITVNDFYHDNESIEITLNPNLEPSQNLEHFFNKAKKAKKAIKEINHQMELTKNEIDYLELIDWQIDEANPNDIKEIEDELIANGYLTKAKNKSKKASKIKIETYQLDDALIYVGKNNLQNDYLTNHFANHKDFFFHVKDAPGSHTIVRATSLNERIIRTAAMIAANFSKLKFSSSIPVDYTSIKDVKKIPGAKGSNVILKNQKTIYIDIDHDYLMSLKKV